MSATIIGGNSPEFEPEIITENGRDGITRFQFRVNGRNLDNLYSIDSIVTGVPGQPPGTFKVTYLSLENVVDGLQRIEVTSEGGISNSLYISESGFQYNESLEPGIINLPLAQIQTQYTLSWLSPSVTVTTNSVSETDGPARDIARKIIASQQVQIIKDRPRNITSGRRVDVQDMLS